MPHEAYCDCTGAPPWPEMFRLHGGSPHHYYLCLECGAVREDVYESGAISEHRWYDTLEGLPGAVRAEALEVLGAPRGEQLELWGEGDG